MWDNWFRVCMGERGDAVRHVLKGRRAVAEGVCAWIDRARRELIDEVS